MSGGRVRSPVVILGPGPRIVPGQQPVRVETTGTATEAEAEFKQSWGVPPARSNAQLGTKTDGVSGMFGVG
jgi:hypothetical protein